MKSHLRLISAALMIGLCGAVCGPPLTGTPKRRNVAALRGFGSAEELRKYLADQAAASLAAQRSSTPYFWGIIPLASPAMMASVAEDANMGGMATGDGASSDPFSTTNIQEEGVDESDIIKNDGTYIYALTSAKIRILKAVPVGELGEVGSIEVPAGASAMYLRGKTLVVLGGVYGDYGNWSGVTTAPSIGAADIAYYPYGGRSQATVSVYDVTNPANPAKLATTTFDGTLTDSRLIDNKLHLVLGTTPALPENPTPLSLASQPLETWLPDYQVVAGDGSVVSSGDVVGWESMFRPDDPDGYGIVTVATLDVDQPLNPPITTSITADAETIYASRDALYITDTAYSYTERASRIDTAVHKLAFAAGGTEYRASGVVPGRPLNQYSLGEFEGHLRIATNSSSFSLIGETGGNNVYVLGEGVGNGKLEVTGKVEGIAPGEQIYSARFVGKRGFLVTFKQIDPLFTLDLSDPANPVVVGELKVPGYSDHLQLLDENHLLSIGKDAQDMGSFAWFQGVQISLFDVTDFANPTLMDKEIIGGRGSNSEANSNPKAFNYFAAKNVLAFPMQVYTASGGGSSYGQHEFDGLYVYRVTVANGFEYLGRIESSGGQTANGCLNAYYGYTRGVFIGDNVYSITERGVKTAALTDVNTLLSDLVFASSPAPLYPDCWYPYLIN